MSGPLSRRTSVFPVAYLEGGGMSDMVSREAAKLVMDDAYRSKAMYEKAQNEVNRLREELFQLRPLLAECLHNKPEAAGLLARIDRALS